MYIYMYIYNIYTNVQKYKWNSAPNFVANYEFI